MDECSNIQKPATIVISKNVTYASRNTVMGCFNRLHRTSNGTSAIHASGYRPYGGILRPSSMPQFIAHAGL